MTDLSRAEWALLVERMVWDMILSSENEASPIPVSTAGVRGVALARRDWLRSHLAHLPDPVAADALLTDCAERDRAFDDAGLAMSATLGIAGELGIGA